VGLPLDRNPDEAGYRLGLALEEVLRGVEGVQEDLQVGRVEMERVGQSFMGNRFRNLPFFDVGAQEVLGDEILIDLMRLYSRL
jgi:hypothetical protein